MSLFILVYCIYLTLALGVYIAYIFDIVPFEFAVVSLLLVLGGGVLNIIALGVME